MLRNVRGGAGDKRGRGAGGGYRGWFLAFVLAAKTPDRRARDIIILRYRVIEHLHEAFAIAGDVLHVVHRECAWRLYSGKALYI